MGGYEIKNVTEQLITQIWKQVENVDLPQIPVMTYREVMARVSSSCDANVLSLASTLQRTIYSTISIFSSALTNRTLVSASR